MEDSRPSATARVVAMATIAAFHRVVQPTPSLQSVELTRRLLAGDRVGRWLARSLDSGAGRAWWRCVERLAAPGFVNHIARRKAWIERACRAALADGFNRVVIVGAGFDTLGMRLCIETSVEVIELDHHATQRLKAEALATNGSRAPVQVPIDLAMQSLYEALAPMVRDCRHTFVIIEGVLMYLSCRRVEQLLDELREWPGDRLRVALTFMDCEPGESPGFRPRSALVEAWLWLVGEPFAWGAPKDKFAAGLVQRGFTVLAMADGQDLAQVWPGERILGETLMVCERAGKEDGSL